MKGWLVRKTVQSHGVFAIALLRITRTRSGISELNYCPQTAASIKWIAGVAPDRASFA